MRTQWLKGLAIAVVVSAAAALALPGFAAAAPGDPDNDGWPTYQEYKQDTNPLLADSDFDGLVDGIEINLDLGDPADADSDDNGIIDALEDSDGGSVPDGVELNNGADPLDDGDDSVFAGLVIKTAAPLPSAANGYKVKIAGNVTDPVFSWTATLANFSSFTVEFDGSPRFANPVRRAASGVLSVNVKKIWDLITQKGLIVYWRVRGTTAGEKKVVYSNTACFTVVGGPVLKSPAADAQNPAGTKITFKWAGADAGYRIIIRGMHQADAQPFILPSTGWYPATQKQKTPSNAAWKKITSLGNEIIWQVVGLTAAGGWAHSEPRTLNLMTGASNLSSTGTDTNTPTFHAISQTGLSATYQMLFSASEEFGGTPLAYTVTAPLEFKPNSTQWNAIKSLGTVFFWTVKGTVGDAYYTFSDIVMENPAASTFTISDGKNDLYADKANKIIDLLPEFTLNTTASSLELVFAGDPRLAGTTAVETMALGQEATKSLDAAAADKIALLNRDYVFMRAKGLTAGSAAPVFSPTYLVRGNYLSQPLNLTTSPVGKLDRNVKYTVYWGEVKSINGYQLEEATDANFTKNVDRFFLPSGTTRKTFLHDEVKGGEVTFYYRVRAIGGVGHSIWSGSTKKTITSPPIRPKVYYTNNRQPFSAGGRNLIIDDFNGNNGTQGISLFDGPGWTSKIMPGYGYKNAYHYITRSGEDGTETATWIPNIRATGYYEVWVSFFATSNRGDDIPYKLVHPGGTTKYLINQKIPGGQTTWVKLGRFWLEAGNASYVRLSQNRELFHSESGDTAAFKWLGTTLP